MLRQKHGGDVFFIWLHRGRSAMPTVIETLMKESGLVAGGFDTFASPLGFLRETADFDYEFEPRLALLDMTDGYIFLRPDGKLTHCTWVPSYITPEMFAACKPFYQAWGKRAGHPMRSASDVNAFFEDPQNYLHQ